MREVEPQPVGRDKRPRLLDVRPEDFAERRVQKVRARVVGLDAAAALGVNAGRDARRPLPIVPRSTFVLCR